MFKYNKDQKRRDELLGIKGKRDTYKLSSYSRFDDLSVETLGILLDEKFINPEEKQNDAPSVGEFYDFMVKHPEYKAIGYAIGLERTDYRTSIEGLTGEGKNIGAILDFAVKFRLADEFDIEGYQRCWYD